MKAELVIGVAIATFAALSAVEAQSSAAPQAGDTVPVTVNNFIRAESDLISAWSR
jgi:hypothetical protein